VADADGWLEGLLATLEDELLDELQPFTEDSHCWLRRASRLDK